MPNWCYNTLKIKLIAKTKKQNLIGLLDDLNYGTNEFATVAMTIRFDNLIHVNGTVGIGTAIGRQTATELATGLTQGGA
jgi:hypothetical protein